MRIDWRINWLTWQNIFKALGAGAAAVGASLGGVNDVFQPLAAVLPVLKPVAPVLAGAGVLVHGLASFAKAGAQAASELGKSNGTVQP